MIPQQTHGTWNTKTEWDMDKRQNSMIARETSYMVGTFSPMGGRINLFWWFQLSKCTNCSLDKKRAPIRTHFECGCAAAPV